MSSSLILTLRQSTSDSPSYMNNSPSSPSTYEHSDCYLPSCMNNSSGLFFEYEDCLGLAESGHWLAESLHEWVRSSTRWVHLQLTGSSRHNTQKGENLRTRDPTRRVGCMQLLYNRFCSKPLHTTYRSGFLRLVYHIKFPTLRVHMHEKGFKGSKDS